MRRMAVRIAKRLKPEMLSWFVISKIWCRETAWHHFRWCFKRGNTTVRKLLADWSVGLR